MAADAVSDAVLVRQTLDGTTEAFGELVHRYANLVYGIARSRTASEDEAEDIVQDAFIAAFRDLHRLRSNEAFGPWLVGIARNLASRAYVLATRRQAREAATGEAGALTEPDDDALEDVEAKEMSKLLWKAVGRLPDRCREAVVLFYFEGLSHGRIAAVLDIAPSTVLSHLDRGRTLLAHDLLPYLQDDLERDRRDDAFRHRVMAGVLALPAVTRSSDALPPTILGLTIRELIVSAAAISAIGVAGWLAVSRGHQGDNPYRDSVESGYMARLVSTDTYEKARRGEVTELIGSGGPFDGASAVAVHPENAQVVWAGDRRGRLRRSLDGGRSWSSLTPDTPTLRWLPPDYGQPSSPADAYEVCEDLLCGVRRILFSPQSSATYMLKAGVTFRSDDNADSWRQIGPSAALRTTHRQALALHPLSDAVIFLGVTEGPTPLVVDEGDGLYRSVDGGRSWEQVLPAAVWDVAVAEADPDVVYAAGRAVNTSADGGTTWTDRAHELFPPGVQWIEKISVDPTDADRVYAGAFTRPGTHTPGLYGSDDGGETWRSMGFEGYEIHVIEIDPESPNIIYAGGGSRGHPSGLFRSTNRGESWTRLHDADATLSLDLDPTDPDVLYHGTTQGLHRFSGKAHANANGR